MQEEVLTETILKGAISTNHNDKDRVVLKMVKHERKGALIIVYSILVQAITGAFILLSSMPLNVARLGMFYRIFSYPNIGAVFMLLSSALAVVGLLDKSKYGFLFFLPQLAFVIFTASSALGFVLRGHYADGVVRPWQFIFVDQLPSFITALLYTYAIFDFRKKRNENVGI